MKYYKLSTAQLRALLRATAKLDALENGGVDNWEWYGISINEFIEAISKDIEKPLNSLDDIVDIDIQEYKSFEE